MKSMMKIAVALAVIMIAGTAYAEIPDVSKWPCPKSVVKYYSEYGIEVMDCHDGSGKFYDKVSGELFYIHEPRTNGDKTVYYNALKTNNGNWVEVINERHLRINGIREDNGNSTVYITDDSGKVIAERTISPLKK